MTTLDSAALRSEFPSLAMERDGRPVVFLDGPGGTQVPACVIDAVSAYFRETNANTGGAFRTSEQSDTLLADAHTAAADFLGAGSPDEITFGANMTTLTFAFSRSIGATLRPGDEIVVTTLDHEANVSPWRDLEERGATVRTVDIHPEDGTLDLDDLDRALGPRTRLVAVGYASNALGTINPVAEIIRRAHAVGAWTYVDAVHFAPHGSIDVRALGADILACSAYKFFGPHVGIVYAREEILAGLPLYKVRPSHGRFETGTLNHEGIAGTLAALDYLASIGDSLGSGVGVAGTPLRARFVAGLAAIAEYERRLADRLLSGLAGIRGIRVWGIADPARHAERCPTVAITIRGVSPRAVAVALGRRGIFTWDGDFYAQALIERLGLFESGGVVRLGLVHYNTAAEVDRTLEALEAIATGA